MIGPFCRNWREMALIVFLLLIVAPLTVSDAEIRCMNSGITVEAKKATSIDAVCGSIETANDSLESIGLELPGDLHIMLHNELPQNVLSHTIGYYDSRRNEIQLLDYDATVRASKLAPPAFGVDTDFSIWRSYLIHELAHAAAHKKFKIGVSQCTASEYIAAVTQITALPPAERHKILANYSEVTGFEKAEEITMAFYMLDPGRFAINAYLHYLKQGNGVQFINRLLEEGLSDE